MGIRQFAAAVLSFLVAHVVASAADDDWNYGKYVQALCAWTKTNAPEGNPVEVRACLPNGAVPEQDTQEQWLQWWGYWFDNDRATHDRLRAEWNAELGRIGDRNEAEKKARVKQQTVARAKADLARIPTMTVPELCKLVRRGKPPEALEELVSRKVYPASEMGVIAGRRIELGMTEGAMTCALGAPVRVNRSVGSWGVHNQYVYEAVTVYTENGKVTSWQE